MHDPIFDIFREEAREHLRSLEQGLLDLDETAEVADREKLVSKLFRHAHNIKGDSRALDLPSIQTAASELEGSLETLRGHLDLINAEVIERTLRELDALKHEFELWQRQISAGDTENSAPGASEFPVTAVPSDMDPEPLAAAATPRSVEDVLSVRVSSERLDQMLNLVGEVRVLQRSDGEMQKQLKSLRSRLDRLTQHLDREHKPAMESAFDHLRRIETSLHRQQSREQVLMQSLEEEISASRLLPVSMLADSLRRPVRDLARNLGKDVRFQVDVGDVLLDKAVIESLRAPLLHLIRNAVDHGIETPEIRQKSGKSSQGTIHFKAGRCGGKVCIEVSDDGAGPDYAKIRERLRSQARLSDDEIATQSIEQLSQWIFQPGFSTAAIGEISGRGVGLDVVRDALQRIQGKIELIAAQGQGTRFRLILPVTISTIRVLTVWSGGQSYGIPSTSVQSTGRIRTSELREIKGTPVILLDGEPVRWVSLDDALKLGRSRMTEESPCQAFVVLQNSGKLLAVQVDTVDEEREVLLKPLSFPLAGMPGILGGTIRPDGSVQLVLDAQLERFRQVNAPGVGPQLESLATRVPRVLVVDDSPTTRALLRNVLTAAGYQVKTAVDGIDALEKLQQNRPDLVISDFEMPRLNGVDLVRQIKMKWNLPVILVTGREQEQHRREGLEAGADAYVIKSTFRGEGLLDVVRQFVGSN